MRSIENYYKILGVLTNASQEEIKHAYRQLARKYHPDVSQETDAEQHFKKVKQAYDTLKDPEKRLRYNKKVVTPVEHSKLQQFFRKFHTERAVARARKNAINRVNTPSWSNIKFSIALVMLIVVVSVIVINGTFKSVENQESQTIATVSVQQDKIHVTTPKQPETQLQQKDKKSPIILYIGKNYRETNNKLTDFFRKTTYYLSGNGKNEQVWHHLLEQVKTISGQLEPLTFLVTSELYSPKTVENQNKPVIILSENPTSEGKFFDQVKNTLYSFATSQKVPDTKQEILSNSLKTCQQHYQENRLVSGEGGNAYACYRQILSQIPDQPDALAGLKALEKRYVAWTEKALKNVEMDKVNIYIKRLAKINPHSPDLVRLKQIIALQNTPKKTVDVEKKKIVQLPQKTIHSEPPPTQKEKPTCKECSCSDILKQLSFSVKPLTMQQRFYYSTQCH